MLIIKICLHTEGKEYVCPYTCEHYNMHTNLLNICNYENGKKSHSCRFYFGNYSEIGYLFMFIGHLLIYLLFGQFPVYVFLPFSFWLIYIFPFNFIWNFFSMSFRILVLTSVEQKSQETTLRVDQISRILRNNWLSCCVLWILADAANLIRGTDYVVEEKCGDLVNKLQNTFKYGSKNCIQIWFT